MPRWLLVPALLACVGTAWARAPVESSHWSHAYDHDFQKYTKRYFGPFWDWRWFKAQAIVESDLNRHARNASGAVGLMQVLPSTFAEIRRANPFLGNIDKPRWNIAAGIYYDYHLYSQPVWDALNATLRLLASFSAYNAGLGRATKAYAATPKPVTSWQQMAPHMPAQTRRYVDRIVHVKTGHPPHRRPRDRGLFGRLHSAP